MESKPKRWRSAGIVAVAMALSFGALFFFGRDPYGFLYDFNPEPFTAYGSRLQTRPAKVLIFGAEESGKALAALKERLRPDQGYKVEDKTSAQSTYGLTWEFSKGLDWVEFNGQPSPSGSTAVVVIEHEPSWAEQTVAKILQFLGMPSKH